MGDMKFRFSLRTLLILVTLCAVACWAYWIGWPWWQIQREQARFVASVKNLKAGVTYSHPPWNMVESGSHCKVIATDVAVANDAVPPSSARIYIWPNAVYLIRCIAEDWKSGGVPPQVGAARSPCIKIEVFKSFPPPPDYRSKWGADYSAKYGCESDLAAIVMEGKPNDNGFKYELIYADPPSKLGHKLPESKPSDEDANQ